LPDRVRRLTDQPVRYVVNTHSHFDHVEGNGLFLATATLIAHHAAASREAAFHAEVLREYPALLEAALQKKDEGGSGWFAGRLEWARQAPAGRAPVPNLTYGSDLTLRLGGETVRLWHVGPGHTDGDTLVFFEQAKVLHTGDLDFHRVIPYLAVSEGSDVPGWIAALDDALQRVPPDVKVIPGHGALTDLAGLRLMRGYLVDLLEAARQAKARGQSQEELVRSVSLPAYASWPGYAERLKDNAAVAYATAR
jgi:cyclase